MYLLGGILRSHVFFGLIAICVGPLQFVKRLRKRRKSIHQFLGYLYCSSVLISSMAGLGIAQFAMGGWITSMGFSILAIFWFFTIIMLATAARSGDFKKHKKWSYFSYALTFATITQRTLLLIPLLTSVPFIPIYQLSACFPWLLNLGIAAYLLSMKPEKKLDSMSQNA
ncbi:MAG: DUF2306 domain-containing protein [Bacteroidota bacterium]